MLYIDIAGNGPRKTCRGVIEWFKSQYLPRHHLDLYVVHRGLKREGVTGWCMPSENTSRPRSFLIEIHNELMGDEYIKALLHELWHVHQHLKCILSETEAQLAEESLYEEFVTEIDNHSKIV